MSKKIITSAIISVLTLATTVASFADTKSATTQTEKCYGISKAGSNDCAAGANSCAGSAKIDNQKDAYLLVPTGLCSKIVGGSTKSVDEMIEKKSS